MLLEYIDAALRHAKYEILSDDGTYYGGIPECNGVYANTDTLEDCRDELREVLEEWFLFRVHRDLSLPIIDRIELTISAEFRVHHTQFPLEVRLRPGFRLCNTLAISLSSRAM